MTVVVKVLYSGLELFVHQVVVVLTEAGLDGLAFKVVSFANLS